MKKTVQNETTFYSLSIFLKYGEVLHLEHLKEEEKNQYFSLCRNKNAQLLIEEDDEIRNLMSEDIARISVVPYSNQYYRGQHRLKSMFFSASGFSEMTFKMIKRVAGFLAILYTLGFALSKILDGSVIEMLGSDALLMSTLGAWVMGITLIYTVSLVIMACLNAVDVLSKPKIPYFVNREGTEEIECSRLACIYMTASVLFFIVILNIVFNIVSQYLA